MAWAMTLQQTVEDYLRDDRQQAAIDLVAQHYAARDGEAAYVLGQWTMAGLFLPRDIARSRALFEQAHSWGFGIAAGVVAALQANGAGGLPRDWTGALEIERDRARSDALIARQVELIDSMAIDAAGNPIEKPAHTMLSTNPRIVVLRGFLAPAECDALIAIAKARLQPAVVVNPQTGELMRDPIRDSQATGFPFVDESPFIHAINRRIAAATGTLPEQGEPVQVLHYRPGQQYRLHSDALNGAANQRFLTFLVYLNDDFEGGATHFPAADLSVRCQTGDAICFANVTADRRPDPAMNHAGTPVTKGEKFVLSRWIRERPLDLGLPSQGKP